MLKIGDKVTVLIKPAALAVRYGKVTRSPISNDPDVFAVHLESPVFNNYVWYFPYESEGLYWMRGRVRGAKLKALLATAALSC